MSTNTIQSDRSQNSLLDARKGGSHARSSKNPTTLPQVATFPFSWKFGTVVELLNEEKANINRPRGRKNQYKICTICGGNGGELRYRKTSDGNSCLICEDCAVQYILSAIRLSHAHGFNRGKIGSE